MYREVKIGAKTVPLQANGATPLWFKQLFHKDIIALMNGAGDDIEKVTDLAPELAYVMAKQAEKADMTKASKEDFMTWLEDFEALDIIVSANEIIETYIANQITSVEGKKKESGSPKGK